MYFKWTMHINKQARCKWARFQFGYCNIKNKLKSSKKRTDKSKSKQQSNRKTTWNCHPNDLHLQTQCTCWCVFSVWNWLSTVPLPALSGKINVYFKFSYVPSYFQIVFIFFHKSGERVLCLKTQVWSLCLGDVCAVQLWMQSLQKTSSCDTKQNTARGFSYRNNNWQPTHSPAREIHLKVEPLILPHIWKPTHDADAWRKEAKQKQSGGSALPSAHFRPHSAKLWDNGSV